MSVWMSSTGIERRYEIDAKQDESNCKKEKSKFQENDETTEERKPRVGGGGMTPSPFHLRPGADIFLVMVLTSSGCGGKTAKKNCSCCRSICGRVSSFRRCERHWPDHSSPKTSQADLQFLHEFHLFYIRFFSSSKISQG